MGTEELTELMIEIKNMGEGDMETVELLTFIEEKLANQVQEDI
ncbi:MULTISPECIES: hypothetical protein [Bacillaceae]|nr:MULTISPECIES: hypothetical protein [Bacillaceae]